MSHLKAILFRRDRLWIAALFGAVGLTAIAAYSFYFNQQPLAQAWSTSDTEYANNAVSSDTVAISETGILVLDVTLPDPTVDTLVHNGTGFAVTAENTLTNFNGTSDQFSDDDHDNAQDYADGALIVSSADTSISAGEIVTSGTADLTAFNSVEGVGMDVFADTETDNNTLDPNEDIYRIIHNGADTFADGDLLMSFPSNIQFYDDNTVGDDNTYNDTEAIISDADADNLPTAGDTVITSGKAGVEAIVLSDNLILDDADSSGNYNAGEVIWKDTTASPGTFDAGSDYVIIGSAAATCGGLCTPISNLANESGFAFLDDNNDGAYTSTRNTSGEVVVWYGNGTNPSDDDSLTAPVTFFDPAQLADDDINGTWIEDMNTFPAADFYLRTTVEGGGPYADGDNIIALIHNGSSTSGPMNEVRLLSASNKFSDADNSNTYTDGELVASSADGNLAAGEVLISGTVDVTLFDSTVTPFYKFHDGSTNGSYTEGEDIATDDDNSTYYNADKMTAIRVNNAGTGDDADLAGMKLYQEDGTTAGFQSGQDTLVMTDADGTYFNSSESVTTDPYSDNVGLIDQRFYVTIDMGASPTNGQTIIATLDSTTGDGNCSTDAEAACAIQLSSTTIGTANAGGDGPEGATTITSAGTITFDSVLPTITNIYTLDGYNTSSPSTACTDSGNIDEDLVDGVLDAVCIDFSENVKDSSITLGNFAVSGATLSSFDTGGGANDDMVVFLFSDGSFATDATPNVAYTAGTLQDNAAGNLMATDGTTAPLDQAPPVIVSTDPADGATNISKSSNVIVVFSEPMTTATTDLAMSFSPDPTGAEATTWSNSDKTVTINPSSSLENDQAYIVTFAATAPSAAVGDPDLSATSFTFTIVHSSSGGGGGGGGGSTSTTPTITVTAPTGEDSFKGGDVTTVDWSVSGSGVSTVKLYYSLDDGAHYTLMASGLNKSDTYDWTVPNVDTDTAIIKAVAMDSGSATLDTDVSGNFSINITSTLPVDDSSTGSSDELMTRDEANADLPDGIEVDNLVRGTLPAVYYIGLDAKRHPFPNEQIYFTWFENFDNVDVISDTDLAAISLGTPVLTRPGTTMVKIVSDPKTYVVEPGYVLRWVTSESAATGLFGSTWNQRIMDIEPTYFTHFSFGDDITDASYPSGSLVKTSSSSTVYFIDGDIRREVTTDGMSENYFQSRFVTTSSDDSWMDLDLGDAVEGLEDALFSAQLP